MQKWNGQLLRKFDDPTEGNASVGTTVVVRNTSNNSLAVIYDVDDVNSVQKNNPFVTDDFGRYSFFAPNGKYTVEFGDGNDSIEITLNDTLDFSDVDHNELLNRNAVGAHDASAIDRSKITVNCIKDLTIPLVSNQSFSVTGFYSGTTTGGGEFVWDATKDKSLHNGGTIIAPEAIVSWDGTNSGLSTLLNWVGAGSGCFVATDVKTPIAPQRFGARSDILAPSGDSGLAIQKAIDTTKYVDLGYFQYNYSTPIDAGSSKVIGAGTQNAKLFYTGNPLVATVSFKYASGAVLEDFRLFGPFSSSQDVSNSLVGLSPNASVGGTTQANRVKIHNVRVESFGINYYMKGTQNSDFTDLFGQYAKYAELFMEATENCWVSKSNTNSPLQVGLGLTPDPDYKLLRLKGNRNLQIEYGIHERAETIDTPYLIDGGYVKFIGTEFNGSQTITSGLIIAKNGARVVLDRCYFTLSGIDKNYVEAQDTSRIDVIDPILSGSGGRHRYALTKGYVTDGQSADCAITLIGSVALSQFYNSSGGTGYIVDNVLLVTGAGAVQGVGITDQPANTAWNKKSGDGLSGGEYTVNIVSMSGCPAVNIYKQLSASPFRVLLGRVTTAGKYSFPTLFNTGDSIAQIGIGVEWDGVTVDPTYGNKGVAKIIGASVKLFRGGNNT